MSFLEEVMPGVGREPVRGAGRAFLKRAPGVIEYLERYDRSRPEGRVLPHVLGIGMSLAGTLEVLLSEDTVQARVCERSGGRCGLALLGGCCCGGPAGLCCICEP